MGLGWCLMDQVYLNEPKVVPNGPKVPKWAKGA